MNKNLFDYNEKLYAEDIISKGKLGKHMMKELCIVGKYYKSMGFKIKEIKDMIIDLCKRDDENFDIDVKFKFINKVVNYVNKPNSNLLVIESIPVTDKELQFVNNIEWMSDEERKLLFGLIMDNKLNKLVAKNYFALSTWNNYWGGSMKSYTDIRKKCNTKTTEKAKSMMKTFVDNGLLEVNVGYKIKLKFIDDIEDGDVVYNLKVMKNFNLLYEKLNGNKKITECQVCGELVRNGKTKITKYCNECYKDIDSELNKKRCKKYRKNNTT